MMLDVINQNKEIDFDLGSSDNKQTLRNKTVSPPTVPTPEPLMEMEIPEPPMETSTPIQITVPEPKTTGHQDLVNLMEDLDICLENCDKLLAHELLIENQFQQ
jgi:hypothetical protein